MLLNKPQDMARTRRPKLFLQLDKEADRLARGLAKVISDFDPGVLDAERLKKIEGRFTSDDFDTADRALWMAAHPASNDGKDANELSWLVDDPRIAFGPHVANGLQVALAYVQDRNMRHADMAKQAVMGRKGIGLLTQSDQLVHLLPQNFFQEEGLELEAARIAGVFSGLRAHPEPARELVKRMLRLPGWRGTAIEADPNLDEFLRTAHLPTTKEWRNQASEALQDLGVLRPTAGQIDEMCCLVLEAPNWHQLLDAVKRSRKDRRGAWVWRTCELVTPGNLEGEELEKAIFDSKRLRVQHETYHGSFESAFSHFSRSVQAMGVFASEWKDLVLQVDAYPSGVDSLMLRPTRMNGGNNMGTPLSAWFMQRVSEVSPSFADPRVHAFVQSKWEQGATVGQGWLDRTFPQQEPLALADEADRILGWQHLVEHYFLRIYTGRLHGEPFLFSADVVPFGGYRAAGRAPGAPLNASAVIFDPSCQLHFLVSIWEDRLRLQAVIENWPQYKLKKLRSKLQPEVELLAQRKLGSFDAETRGSWDRSVSAWLVEHRQERGVATNASMRL